MQKTEQFAWLLRLSTIGKGFCVAVSLLVLFAIPLRAGEPVMALAMNEPSANSAATSLDLPSGKDDSLFNLENSRPEVVSLDVEKAAVSSGGQMENQTNLGEHLSLQFVREDSHPEKPVSITAGYGQIWNDQSTLKKIVTDYQEPGCAYVSANFSF